MVSVCLSVHTPAGGTYLGLRGVPTLDGGGSTYLREYLLRGG